MDPQNRNAKMMDQHNALPQVNQVHTVRKAGFGMANSCSTDHHCKFNNNIVLMFQNVNVAKSAPFALLTIYQKSLYPPKFLKLPHSGKLRKIRRPFFDLNNDKWNPPISQQIARKSLNFATLNNELREICAILVKSYQSLLPNCTPTFLQQISLNSLNSQILRANDVKLTNFALIPTNLLFYFFDSRKTGSSTLLARITRIPQP